MSIISSFWRLPSSGKLFMAEMEKSSCLVAMGAFLCLLGASQNASAANYFNWGAESDNTSRGPILSYAGQTTRDCTVAHSGSCSMRLNVIGNDGGNQQMGAEPGNFTYPDPAFVGSRAIYYRWWMKIMVGFSWGAFDQKTKSDRVQGNGVPGGYTGYLNSTSFELGEAVQASSDPASTIPYVFLGDSTWHEYIVMVKPNTTSTSIDAQFNAWVDGVPVGQKTGFRLTQDTTGPVVESWGGWMVRPYFQLRATSLDGGTIYLDDFSTDDSWNSLIPASPFNRLLPPGNLRVK